MTTGLNWLDGLVRIDETEVISLFYYKEENYFVDEDGDRIENILDFITPNDLLLFRWHRGLTIVRHRSRPGVSVELYYPVEDEYYFDRTIYHGYI